VWEFEVESAGEFAVKFEADFAQESAAKFAAFALPRRVASSERNPEAPKTRSPDDV
jgi:hypothetical protein